MDLPKEVIFKATLKPGGVFLYEDDDFPEKAHFFVVLNSKIKYGEPLILACATSQIKKRIERINKFGISLETLIIVHPKECNFLDKETAFDCNRIHVRPIEVLKEKMDTDKIHRYSEVSIELLDKLRVAVKKSPLVETKFKKLL